MQLDVDVTSSLLRTSRNRNVQSDATSPTFQLIHSQLSASLAFQGDFTLSAERFTTDFTSRVCLWRLSNFSFHLQGRQAAAKVMNFPETVSSLAVFAVAASGGNKNKHISCLDVQVSL